MKFLTRKKIILGIVVVVAVVAVVAFKGGNKVPVFQSEVLSEQDIARTVLATGTVTSSVDLGLAFKASGIVQRVPVKVGQKVKAGTVLAQLDQRDVLATVAQARASVASAEASLQKVRDGATSEEVAVAQVALDNAKKSLEDTKLQQDTLVANARLAVLNISLEATPAYSITGSMTVSGSYVGGVEGSYRVAVYATGSGLGYIYSGLENGTGFVRQNLAVPLGTKGLLVTFPSSVAANDEWTITIPNKKSSSYVTYLNAYNSALETQRTAVASAESAVATAEANLALKKAMARPADLSAAEASVLSAKAGLQSALANLENTIIRAPVAGTVTKVDVKVGEQATALTPLVFLQDVENLYVEGLVSEANIALVSTGQKVTYTFDALGLTKEFSGTVTAIDPASTVVSGVVNYKVTSNIEGVVPANGVQSATDDSGLKILPGMTANMSVKVAEKQGVLAVPQRALLEKNGKDFVRVVTNKEKGVFEEKPVTLGLEADGGFVEVLSGLSAGQEIVTFIEETK